MWVRTPPEAWVTPHLFFPFTRLPLSFNLSFPAIGFALGSFVIPAMPKPEFGCK
jgi:hypothetical protein